MSLHPEHALAHLIIGVADMTAVRALWIDHFGLEVVGERCGPDPDLARTWALPDDAITEQLMLRTPGARAGWLHFVQFAQPAPAVRAGAAPTDLCPKNIDVNCVAIPTRFAELEASGYTFRSAVSTYAIDELQASEVQMPAHDDLNVVLIEVENWPISLSPRHYGAVTSFVAVVQDIEAEARFYQQLLGLEHLMRHRIAGPEIEKVVGLPAGSVLQMQLLGGSDELFGRIELIAYEGAEGRDLYPRAAAPAVGILGCRFRVSDAAAVLERAAALDILATDLGVVETLCGSARHVLVTSPAGLKLELFESS